MKRFPVLLLALSVLVSCMSPQRRIEEAARLGQLNVLLFGAKGDGVPDDTEAIQRAIDYLDSRGGGKLYFPYTKYGYLLSSPAKEYTADGTLVRAQLILPAGDSNIQFEGEMPCKLLYTYQVRPPESVAQNFEPTRFGTMGMPNTCLHSTWDAPEVTDSLERPWAVLAAPEGDSCDGRFSRNGAVAGQRRQSAARCGL